MSYFDDPKHRAEWEKELSELRAEKEQKAKNPSSHINSVNIEKTAEKVSGKKSFYREQITYAELLALESLSVAEKRTAAPQKEMKKDVQMEM